MMRQSSRRIFLRRLLGGSASTLLMPLVPSLLGKAFAQEADEDEEIFRKKFLWATSNSFAGKPMGEITSRIGISFLGAPYVENPLDPPGEEHLVVNLHAFDCVTFVETSLALARCVKAMASSYQDYTRELRRIRYRSGVMKGYASRLHYFSDWIRDNEEKGVVRNVTQGLGGRSYHKALNFMTSHRGSYPQLADDAMYRELQKIEHELLQYPLLSIPSTAVLTAERKIRSGDIIAIASSIEGLDVTHTGMAVAEGRTVRFLHAPLSGGTVLMSEGTLSEYVTHLGTSAAGIMVARPQEP